MHIGIDIFSYNEPGENYGVGPGVYVWNLLPELFRIGRSHRFTIFANSENVARVPSMPNVKVVVSPFSSRIRALRILHEQVFLPREFTAHSLDIMHFMGNNISFRLGSRSVLTVYDLMWKYYLDRGSRSPKHLYFAATIPRSLRRAGIVIAISGHVAAQVQQLVNRKQGSIVAVPLAPGMLAEPSVSETIEFDRNYDFPFVLTVTTSMPHKNLETLLRAVAGLRSAGTFDGRLVVVGQLKGRYHLRTQRLIRALGLEDAVLLRGFVQEKEKTYCYRNALVFVYPSFYEGFGLPILEAMACGTPVVASRAASIPEVGGDACQYFDPNSVEELKVALMQVLSDKILREALSARGKQREKMFRWDKVAAKTIEAYDTCAALVLSDL